jgi:hypothetical protein
MSNGRTSILSKVGLTIWLAAWGHAKSRWQGSTKGITSRKAISGQGLEQTVKVKTSNLRERIAKEVQIVDAESRRDMYESAVLGELMDGKHFEVDGPSSGAQNPVNCRPTLRPGVGQQSQDRPFKHLVDRPGMTTGQRGGCLTDQE